MKRIIDSWIMRLKQLESHPWVLRFAVAADHVTEIALQPRYEGNNPAIAAAYGPLRTSLLVMLVLFFVIFILGALVPIESAAVAHGTIVVMSNKKTVQHLEGGVIREILVKDGDVVKENQPLIVLNDVAPKANQSMVSSDLATARITEARLLALRDNTDHMTISEEILKQSVSNPDIEKTIATQTSLFTIQKETHIGKVNTLKQRIEQSNEEIVGLQAQVKSAEGQLRLIAQEVGPMERLVSKGYAAKPQLLALKRQQQELEGNRGQYLAAIAKARQGVTETEMQIVNANNDFATEIADEMRDIQAKITDFEEKLRATSDVMARTIITAPYEGVVNGLKYHTIGGVITPGTPIMDIVPQSDKLIVEAQVHPTDIDVVETGMDTRIVFSAYKTRNMPRLKGKVVNVSADAFTPQQGMQASSYYTARVEVDSEQLSKLDTKVKLYPGMPVEVFIHTGARSFIGYMLAPISGSLNKAFKED